MDLIYLVIILAVVGFLLHLLLTHIPMEPIVRTIILIVVVIVLVFFLLRKFGAGIPNFF